MLPIQPDQITISDIADAEADLRAASRAVGCAYDAWRAAMQRDALCAPLLAAYDRALGGPASGAAYAAIDAAAMLRAPRECAGYSMSLAARAVAERRVAALRAAALRAVAAELAGAHAADPLVVEAGVAASDADEFDRGTLADALREAGLPTEDSDCRALREALRAELASMAGVAL